MASSMAAWRACRRMAHSTLPQGYNQQVRAARSRSAVRFCRLVPMPISNADMNYLRAEAAWGRLKRWLRFCFNVCSSSINLRMPPAILVYVVGCLEGLKASLTVEKEALEELQNTFGPVEALVRAREKNQESLVRIQTLIEEVNRVDY